MDVKERQICPRKSAAAFWHADSLFQSLGSHQAGGVVLFHNKDTCCQEGHFPSACHSNTSARSRCRSLLCTKIKALPQMAQLHPLKCFSLSCHCSCTPVECSDRPDGKRQVRWYFTYPARLFLFKAGKDEFCLQSGRSSSVFCCFEVVCLFGGFFWGFVLVFLNNREIQIF